VTLSWVRGVESVHGNRGDSPRSGPRGKQRFTWPDSPSTTVSAATMNAAARRSSSLPRSSLPAATSLAGRVAPWFYNGNGKPDRTRAFSPWTAFTQASLWAIQRIVRPPTVLRPPPTRSTLQGVEPGEVRFGKGPPGQWRSLLRGNRLSEVARLVVRPADCLGLQGLPTGPISGFPYGFDASLTQSSSKKKLIAAHATPTRW